MTSFIKKIGSPVKIIFLGIIFSVIATLIISVGQIPQIFSQLLLEIIRRT